MTLHDEISIWISAYSIFWLAFTIYQVIDQIKKVTTDRRIKNEKDEELIEQLNDQLVVFVEIASMKVFIFLSAAIITLIFALDLFGYFLTYAYVPLEGMRQMLFYAAVIGLCLHNFIRIADFSKIIRKLGEDMTAKEIVKDMNSYTLQQRIFFIISTTLNLYFALQLNLHIM